MSAIGNVLSYAAFAGATGAVAYGTREAVQGDGASRWAIPTATGVAGTGAAALGGVMLLAGSFGEMPKVGAAGVVIGSLGVAALAGTLIGSIWGAASD